MRSPEAISEYERMVRADQERGGAAVTF